MAIMHELQIHWTTEEIAFLGHIRYGRNTRNLLPFAQQLLVYLRVLDIRQS